MNQQLHVPHHLTEYSNGKTVCIFTLVTKHESVNQAEGYIKCLQNNYGSKVWKYSILS